VGRLRDLINGPIENGFVSFGRLAEATELTHELQCRRADFFIGGRRFEVVQRLNISTHKNCFLIYRLVPQEKYIGAVKLRSGRVPKTGIIFFVWFRGSFLSTWKESYTAFLEFTPMRIAKPTAA
jgi:hypothetical protein